MTGFKLTGLALAATLILGTAAYADGHVALSEEQTERLAEGGRVRVIVMLEDPGTPSLAPDSLAERTRAIRELQTRAVSQSLGVTLDELQARRDRFESGLAQDLPDGALPPPPRLSHAYRYTPALAMTLDQSEIDVMSSAPGVESIIEDIAAQTMMDESLPLIGANVLHDLDFDGSGFAVAILDTGTDHDHPMIADGIVGSACFSTTDPAIHAISRCPGGRTVEVGGRSGDDCDRCQVTATHGTHVGGIAAGRPVTANMSGTNHELLGVAPGAGIVAVNVFYTDTDDQKAYSQTSDQLAALEWLYDNRTFPDPDSGDPIQLAAINMSLGGGYTEDFCATHPLAPIVTMLRSAGVATVIASGNEFQNEGLAEPACIGQAITVGATDRNDAVASFSNSHFVVDLLAPGVEIRASTDMEGSTPLYDAYNGTSMATPHVAGAIALLRSAVPQASLDQIEFALKTTGRPVTDTDNDLTRPRIQLNAAHSFLVDLTQEIGPVAVSPTTDYYSTVDVNRPESPDVELYTVTNNGSAAVDVTVSTVNNDAITFGSGLRTLETTLEAGDSFQFGIEIDLAAVRLGRNEGEIRVEVDHDAGAQVIPIRAVVLGYAGAPPTTRPFNDNFADAVQLTDGQLSFTTSTFGATTQIGEPDHGGEENGGSIWYSIEAQRPGSLRINVSGRVGQTSIGIYTGSSLAALTTVASVSSTGGPATLEFDPVEGETYYMAIDYNPVPNTGGTGERDPVTVTLTPLAGEYDYFATALELTAPGDTGVLSFGGSTVEPDEPSQPSEGGTLWLHATGNPGDTFEMQILATTRNAAFTLFDGDALDSLTSLGAGFGSTRGAYNEAASVTLPADGDIYIQVSVLSVADGDPNETELFYRYRIGAEEDPARVVTSVAPQFRVVQPNQFTSALVGAVASASGSDARECGVLPPLEYPGIFRFMPLSPVSGDSGDAVDIPRGTVQNFAFGTQRNAITQAGIGFDQLSTVPVAVSCDNGAAIEQTSLNTLFLTVSDLPLADIVAATALSSGNAVELSENGATRFAVAAFNVSPFGGPVVAVPVAMDNNYYLTPPGAVSEYMLFGDDAFPTLPLDLEICESDPATGACYGDFSRQANINDFTGSSTRTFVVRVAGQGEAIAFSPANNRILVAFVQVESLDQITPATMRLVGGSSVAVRTLPAD